MTDIDLDALEALAASSLAIAPMGEFEWYAEDSYSLSVPTILPQDRAFIAAANPATALSLIGDLRRAQECIDQIEDFVVRHYLDTQMGRGVLALIDPTTYDEGASDGK